MIADGIIIIIGEVKISKEKTKTTSGALKIINRQIDGVVHIKWIQMISEEDGIEPYWS